MGHMKKILLKLSISLVLSIVLTVGIAAVILNVYERVSCKEFFSIKKNLCVNPGLFDNCVPQGITYNYDEDCFVTSCYMSNDTESRIYKVKKVKKKVVLYIRQPSPKKSAISLRLTVSLLKVMLVAFNIKEIIIILQMETMVFI